MGGQLTKEQSDLPFGYLSPKDLENEKIQNLLKSRNNVKNMKKLITNASNTEEDNNIMDFNAYHIGICSKCLKNDIYESLSSDLTIPEADLCEDLCKECRFGVCNKYDQPNSHNKWCQRCEYGICVDCFDVNDYYGYCEKCNSHGQGESKSNEEATLTKRLLNVLNNRRIFSAIWKDGKKSIQDFIKKHDKTCPIEPSVESLEPIKVVIKETETNETFWNEIDYYKEKDCLYAHDIESYGVTLRPITKRPSIVMELGSLCDFVGKLGWRAKIENIRLIVKSLSKLHELNYIHGDLHSGNILVKKYLTNEINNSKLVFILSDFGLMHKPESICQPTDNICGILEMILTSNVLNYSIDS
ncbi:8699_t:CDS:2 [Entrophospora sp. SA101]|nr:8699_t:CDS:2 [Entrophospora sp. SA101]